MQSNPFSPPRAIVKDVADDTAASRLARPLAVWTLQALLALLACGIAVAEVQAGSSELSVPDVDWAYSLVLLTAAILSMAALIATIVAIHRRRQAGRWLGLAIIGGILVWSVWLCINTLLPNALTRPLANSRIVASIVIGSVILAPPAFWFWAFGLSAKARAWFRASSAR